MTEEGWHLFDEDFVAPVVKPLNTVLDDRIPLCKVKAKDSDVKGQEDLDAHRDVTPVDFSPEVRADLVSFISTQGKETLTALEARYGDVFLLTREMLTAMEAGDWSAAAGHALRVKEKTFLRKGFPHVACREACTYAHVIMCVSSALAGRLLSAFHHLDWAIVLGFPVETLREITRCMEEVFATEIPPANPVPISRPPCQVERQMEELSHWDPAVSSRQAPAVVRGGCRSWPCVTSWQDPHRLAAQFGHRWVPIECGSLEQGDWEERFVSLRAFLAMLSEPRTAYLAQHPLLAQLPLLAESIGELVLEKPVAVSNVWWGTAGTVTPAHVDSYDNFLCQVVGYKYVRLWAPNALRASNKEGLAQVGAQKNIAWDALEQSADFVDVLLGPGDVLMIPHFWWHYCRAESRSMSVNFWF